MPDRHPNKSQRNKEGNPAPEHEIVLGWRTGCLAIRRNCEQGQAAEGRKPFELFHHPSTKQRHEHQDND
jgi:hypothetical protein